MRFRTNALTIAQDLQNASHKMSGAAMRLQVMKAAHKVARSAKLQAPSASGALIRQIMVHPISNTKAQVVSHSNYGVAVEQGVPGSKVRMHSYHLIPWMKSKGMIKNATHPTSEDKGYAFAIMQSLKGKGIRKQPYMNPAFEQNKASIHALFDRFVGTEVQKI